MDGPHHGSVGPEEGSADYGAAWLPEQSLSPEEPGKNCGSFIAGPDWPVLLLPWLLFAQPLLICSAGGPVLLWALALVYGLGTSAALARLSLGRGGPWLFHGLFCFLSTLMGLAMGLVLQVPKGADNVAKPTAAVLVFLWLHLLSALTFSRALPRLNCALVGSSAAFAEARGWGWHPRTAAVMRFGSESWRSKLPTDGQPALGEQSTPSPGEVSWDLMRRRCYWSGEPALDYVFHLANNHTFIGVLLCHPGNPYDKVERFAVLLIFSMLVIFPVAAMETATKNVVVRCVFTLFLVTVPRNLLRAYLQHIVIADEEILSKAAQSQQKKANTAQEGTGAWKWQAAARRLTQSRRVTHSWKEAAVALRAEKAFWWEVTFFACSFLVCGLLAIPLSLYVKAHNPKPLGTCLWESAEGLGWAFVLELIFDLTLNHRGSDKLMGIEEHVTARDPPRPARKPAQEQWFAGFFHRWGQERDEWVKKQAESLSVKWRSEG